jgi:putative transposase
MQYLWRAVNQNDLVVDVFVQAHTGSKAAEHFICRLFKRHGDEPCNIVTDKLRSYGIALRELIPEAIHNTSQCANNRAELSRQPTRVRVRASGGCRFKSHGQVPRCLDTHAAVYNTFTLGRHLIATSY